MVDFGIRVLAWLSPYCPFCLAFWLLAGIGSCVLVGFCFCREGRLAWFHHFIASPWTGCSLLLVTFALVGEIHFQTLDPTCHTWAFISGLAVLGSWLGGQCYLEAIDPYYPNYPERPERDSG